MKPYINEVLYIEEIEELIENTGLLSDPQVKELFFELIAIKDQIKELNNDNSEDVIELFERMAKVTSELTKLIETKFADRDSIKKLLANDNESKLEDEKANFVFYSEKRSKYDV